VGVLDNNMERQFGMENLLSHELYVLIGEELDDNFKLERTNFLRLISGEDIMIARKNKIALKRKLPAHLACCGNKMIGYEDHRGELKRRIVSWMFDHKVLPSQVDPLLDEKLWKELPAIMQKVVRAYQYYSQKYGHKSIWSVLPNYFKDSQRRIAERSNPKRAFLESNDVVYGEEYYISETELRNRFMEFCKARNFKRQRFALEGWKSDFQEMSNERNVKISIEIKGDRVYPRNGGMMMHRENFILGMDVLNQDAFVFGGGE
jgi:hypothetical protein